MSASWLEILPAIGTFLGGPAGGIVGSGVEWLANKLGASDKTVEGIKETLSGMKPEDLLNIKKLDIEFQEFCLDNNIKLDLAQIGVNLQEAKAAEGSTSFLVQLIVAGWRPAVGWVCAMALFYAAIAEPVLRFSSQVWFKYTGSFPAIDTTITLQVLGALLGTAVLRSFDKQQGTSKTFQ